jgi:hypothetical protein
VDVELYTDEVDNVGSAEARDELFQLIGVHVAGAYQGSLPAFARRFPWLACNLVAGILAALLSGIYRYELQTVVALAFFIPVVTIAGEGNRWKILPGIYGRALARTGSLAQVAKHQVQKLTCVDTLPAGPGETRFLRSNIFHAASSRAAKPW